MSETIRVPRSLPGYVGLADGKCLKPDPQSMARCGFARGHNGPHAWQTIAFAALQKQADAEAATRHRPHDPHQWDKERTGE